MHLTTGQPARSLDILVNLKVHAAFQLGALSGQLLGVEREVLEAGGSCGDAGEVLHPGGAAELTATRSEASDASGLLARADLLHLDAHVEGLGQHLDELTEVHTAVGDVVEDGFQPIALIFHVADFHLESQFLGNLSAADHGIVFAGLGFLELLHVHGAGLAVDTLELLGILGRCALHLQQDELAGEGHRSDIMSGRCLYGHDVAFLQRQMVGVMVIPLSGVLELHFDEVCRLCVAGDVGKVVEDIELAALLWTTPIRETAVAEEDRYCPFPLLEGGC